jgi:hypothetical protein
MFNGLHGLSYRKEALDELEHEETAVCEVGLLRDGRATPRHRIHREVTLHPILRKYFGQNFYG